MLNVGNYMEDCTVNRELYIVCVSLAACSAKYVMHVFSSIRYCTEQLCNINKYPEHSFSFFEHLK